MMAIHSIHDVYMVRCLELARKGAGYVRPNPMVGAVLVYEDKIIGEGYHEKYGQAHAEVNCIASVQEKYRYLISQSTMYVTLEPCAHFGKTPPCADLIIANNIPHVVVGCRDPFEEVNGKGIEKLRVAGIQVNVGILESEAKDLNKRFFTFHTKSRPYIILKWAQTSDKKIGYKSGERLYITNDFSNRLVHQWRSEEAGIIVGTNTALMDNPSLTNRLAPGPTPVRIVIDRQLLIPITFNLFDNQASTIIINELKDDIVGNRRYVKMSAGSRDLTPLLKCLWTLNIQSVLVEGGAKLLEQFISQGHWDEARIFTNQSLSIGDGIEAPLLEGFNKISEDQLDSDKLEYFRRADS